MQIIISHENTDFDALASMLGAAKLYPDAVPVLPRRLNRNLRDFLTIYWDELPFIRFDDLPKGRIERVILVDTQTFPPIRGVGPHTEVTIIDHHHLTRELPDNWTHTSDDTGANTTIFVEQMARDNTPLSPIEATLLLLGIYEDTGGLTYAATTPRDVRCAAWLLEKGASLEVLNNFLHYPLTDKQRQLYHQLIENAQPYVFAGQSVIIATAKVDEYVEEISTLAHKLRELFDPAALFLLVDMGDHVQMVARSTSDAVDVGHIATHHFEGGGHSRAAAAIVRDMDVAAIQRTLLDVLSTHAKPSVTVGQIMSFGVHTVSPDTTVAEADEMMRRYGHEGFPVVEDGRIVGTLTRREIDRALHHGLGNAPIKVYMQKGEVSVSPGDSVEHLQQVMMEHSLGQVPVVDDGRIIGIVTRTDLIKLWGTPRRPGRRRADEIAALLDKALPAPLLALIRQASQTAGEMGYSLYLVGGFVRDLLLGIPNFDLDMVVEGDAIALAERLAQQMGGRVRSHRRFGTAKWLLEGTGVSSIPSVDFATARTEFYEHPTALPQVERSSIKQDLHRRDFTINTLAIRLDPEHYGQLLDFYGGERDLNDKLIRVLHSLSFVEDPTRMLRAARLEQRLGFRIEERTEELMADALDLLDRISGERIRHELALIFQEDEPERALRRLEGLGVLAHIHPALRCNGWLEKKYEHLRASFAKWHEPGWPAPALTGDDESTALHPMPGPSVEEDLSLPYLALLVYRLDADELEEFITRLKIVRSDATVLREVNQLAALIPDLSQNELLPSTIFRLLRPYSIPAIFITWLACDSWLAQQRMEMYHRRLRHVRPSIDGAYLQQLGIEPGPVYGRILDAVRDARLDGRVATRQEEEELVRELLGKEENVSHEL